MVLVVAGCVTPPPSGFLAYSAPVTGAVDVITGIPVCGGLGGPGATGLAAGGTWFYVTDACTGRVYRYRAGTVPMALASSADDNVTGGVAVFEGWLFGVTPANKAGVRPGLYAFDPLTLRRVKLVVAQPEGCLFRTVVAAGVLYLPGDCGLLQVTGPAAAVPLVVQLATGNLGAATVAPGGDVWALDLAHSRLIQYRPAPLAPPWHAVAAVPLADGPTGVVSACSAAPPALAGDLLVNNADGVLSLVDLHRHGAVSILASGGLHGADLACGPDGNLYVTQASRVQRMLFSGLGTGEGRAGAGGDPAGHAVYPLVLSGGLLAVSLVGLLSWRIAGRRRRGGARP